MSDDPTPEQPNHSEEAAQQTGGLAGLWAELRRRHVVRVAITYAVVGWLIMQVANLTFEGFGIPLWAFRFVMLLVILGFPVAIVLAWAFELTPQGIKTTKAAKKQKAEEPPPETFTRKRALMAYVIGAAVPTAIFSILAVFFYFKSGDETEAAVEDKSIAVLPLENMSPDPENAFFADGVHEDILTNLSKIKSLDKVISRSSTLRFRDPNRDLRRVGETLGVRYLLEGSVRRAGNEVQVTVQLIDAREDDHVWAETYQRTLDDIFAIQAEVALKIANQLKAALTPEEVAKIDRRPTQNQDACDLYLKAREFGLGDPEVEQLCERATVLDPEFAEAWSLLARNRMLRWRWIEGRNNDELLEKTHHAYREAVRFGPNLAEVFRMQNLFAYNEDKDIYASIDFLRRALAIEPNRGDIKGVLAWRYTELGLLENALRYFEDAHRIDPLLDDPSFYGRFSIACAVAGRWEQAEAILKHRIEISDNDEYWNASLIELEYLQTGNKTTYVNELKENVAYNAIAGCRVWLALLECDYLNALEHLNEIEKRLFYPDTNNVRLAHYASLALRPLSTLNALIWFEVGDEEKMLPEIRNSKEHLLNVIEHADSVDPAFWTNLAIVYALEGNRERMENSASQARMLSSDPYYRFTNQTRTEMTIAIAYLVLGDNDKAIETLEAASKMNGTLFPNRELDLWFIFDRLRGNPRFDRLLED